MGELQDRGKVEGWQFAEKKIVFFWTEFRIDFLPPLNFYIAIMSIVNELNDDKTK